MCSSVEHKLFYRGCGLFLCILCGLPCVTVLLGEAKYCWCDWGQLPGCSLHWMEIFNMGQTINETLCLFQTVSKTIRPQWDYVPFSKCHRDYVPLSGCQWDYVPLLGYQWDGASFRLSLRLCASFRLSLRLCASFRLSVRLCASFSGYQWDCASFRLSMRLWASFRLSVRLCLFQTVHRRAEGADKWPQPAGHTEAAAPGILLPAVQPCVPKCGREWPPTTAVPVHFAGGAGQGEPAVWSVCHRTHQAAEETAQFGTKYSSFYCVLVVCVCVCVCVQMFVHSSLWFHSLLIYFSVYLDLSVMWQNKKKKCAYHWTYRHNEYRVYSIAQWPSSELQETKAL